MTRTPGELGVKDIGKLFVVWDNSEAELKPDDRDRARIYVGGNKFLGQCSKGLVDSHWSWDNWKPYNDTKTRE